MLGEVRFARYIIICQPKYIQYLFRRGTFRDSIVIVILKYIYIYIYIVMLSVCVRVYTINLLILSH